MNNNINSYKTILIITLLTSLFFFSGCGEEINCSDQDTTYTKYSLDEEQDKCVVSKRISKDECGNDVEEEGETYCNCKEDIGKAHPELGCEGSLGEYLEKSCSEETLECELFQNKKVIQDQKSLELKNSDIIFDVRISFMSPFILNSADKNKMPVDISLFKFVSPTSKNIKNIIVKELKIENPEGTLLGNIVYNEQLTNIEDKVSTNKISIQDTKKYSTKDSLKVKLIVTYTKEILDNKGEVTKTEDKIETLISSLGRLVIINPNLYEED